MEKTRKEIVQQMLDECPMREEIEGAIRAIQSKGTTGRSYVALVDSVDHVANTIPPAVVRDATSVPELFTNAFLSMISIDDQRKLDVQKNEGLLEKLLTGVEVMPSEYQNKIDDEDKACFAATMRQKQLRASLAVQLVTNARDPTNVALEWPLFLSSICASGSLSARQHNSLSVMGVVVSSTTEGDCKSSSNEKFFDDQNEKYRVTMGKFDGNGVPECCAGTGYDNFVPQRNAGLPDPMNRRKLKANCTTSSQRGNARSVNTLPILTFPSPRHKEMRSDNGRPPTIPPLDSENLIDVMAAVRAGRVELSSHVPTDLRSIPRHLREMTTAGMIHAQSSSHQQGAQYHAMIGEQLGVPKKCLYTVLAGVDGNKEDEDRWVSWEHIYELDPEFMRRLAKARFCYPHWAPYEITIPAFLHAEQHAGEQTVKDAIFLLGFWIPLNQILETKKVFLDNTLIEELAAVVTAEDRQSLREGRDLELLPPDFVMFVAPAGNGSASGNTNGDDMDVQKDGEEVEEEPEEEPEEPEEEAPQNEDDGNEEEEIQQLEDLAARVLEQQQHAPGAGALPGEEQGEASEAVKNQVIILAGLLSYKKAIETFREDFERRKKYAESTRASGYKQMKLQFPPILANANDVIQTVALSKAWMNFTRRRYGLHILRAAVKAITPGELNWRQNSFLEMSFRMIGDDSPLALATDVHVEFNSHHNPLAALELLPRMARLYAGPSANTPLTVVECLYQVANMCHLRRYRPDCLPQVVQDADTVAEVKIEHNNSIDSREIRDKKATDMDPIRKLHIGSFARRQSRSNAHDVLKQGQTKKRKYDTMNDDQDVGEYGVTEAKKISDKFLPTGSLAPLITAVKDEWLLPLLIDAGKVADNGALQRIFAYQDLSSDRYVDLVERDLERYMAFLNKAREHEKKLVALEERGDVVPLERDAFTHLIGQQNAPELQKVLKVKNSALAVTTLLRTQVVQELCKAFGRDPTSTDPMTDVDVAMTDFRTTYATALAKSATLKKPMHALRDEKFDEAASAVPTELSIKHAYDHRPTGALAHKILTKYDRDPSMSFIMRPSAADAPQNDDHE